jgi:hypothetical protein
MKAANIWGQLLAGARAANGSLNSAGMAQAAALTLCLMPFLVMVECRRARGQPRGGLFGALPKICPRSRGMRGNSV